MTEENKVMSMITTDGVVDPHMNIVFLLGCTEMFIDSFDLGEEDWRLLVYQLYMEKSQAERIITKIFNCMEITEDVRKNLYSFLEESWKEFDPFDADKFMRLVTNHKRD